jgi:hypothetical protein
MLNYRDGSLDDREDFTGMNDFETHQPPLFAHLEIDGCDAMVTVACDDDSRFKIELFLDDQQASLIGERAAFAMVTLRPSTTLAAIREIFGTFTPCTF